jgi:tRNA A-37 threonylcarbamoyl transferase component Bud32
MNPGCMRANQTLERQPHEVKIGPSGVNMPLVGELDWGAMPSCPRCEMEYPAGTAVCPRDGAPLLGGAGAPVAAVPAAAAPSAGVVAVGGASAALELASAPTLPELPAVTAAAPAMASFDPLVGAALAGRYLIVRRIGEGGMGAVYEAKHTVIGKRVAVKVLLEKFHSNTDFVARLLQEARLASSIGHENIVDVTDFGTTDDGRSFVVMEFLEGEPLAQLVIREAPLPVERCLRIARQVASALSAAHAKGIFHRDIKPENVYLIRRGDADFVKVVDFGISKAVKQGGEDPAESYRLTHTGLLLGTPLYMSPEQARGEDDLDHRVDIWALGVMLYECLTGEVPFHANNYLGIISQVLTHTAAPPSQLRPELGIAESVEAVVMRAMEKDRRRRYQTMADLERDLERLLAGDQNVGSVISEVPARAVAAGAVPRRWHLVTAGALVIAAGVIMSLRHPGDVHSGASLEPERAARAPALAPPAVTARPAGASAAAAGSAATGGGAAESAAASKAVKAVAARRKGVRVERKPSNAGARVGGQADPSESAKRGVLPLGSREAYPDQ